MHPHNHAYRHTDRYYRWFCQLSACLPLILIIILVASMTYLSWPSIKAFGIHFLYATDWDPATQAFGALPILVGTLISTCIALILAVPTAFCVAVLLNMIVPPKIALILSRMVETMASIPSIIYGLWGLFVLVPLLSQHVFIHLIGHFSNVPILSFVFNGVPVGTTLLTAGVVLAVMIFPLITAMMRDVLGTIPALVTEASFGVGLSRLQVVRRIYIRYARAGLLGSIVLGMGRALGETMAVTFVIGNAHGMPQGLMVPGTTISATIANEFTEAMGKLYISSLVQLGLILFIIAFICLLISRRILKQSLTRGGSV